MPSAWIQSAAFNAGSPMSFPSNITNGSNLYAVVRRGGSSSQPSSLSDTLGNTWTKVPSSELDVSGDHTLAVWQALNSPAGANAVSESGGAGTDRVVLIEVSGLDIASPVDQVATNTGTDTHPAATTGVLTQANEFILVAASDTNGGSTYTLGSGYGHLTTIDQKLAYEDKTVASTSTVTGDFTFSVSQSWGVVVVTLKDAGSAAPLFFLRPQSRPFPFKPGSPPSRNAPYR